MPKMNISKNYGPMSTTMPLLHPVHKSQRMNSLVNFDIQLFQQRSTIINEQSQKDINSLFDLIYDIKVNHACKWSSSTPLLSTFWSQYRLVLRTSSINIPLLGMYYTDNHFISTSQDIILSTNVLLMIFYTYIFLSLQDSDTLHISYIEHSI
jgi:hypothetical protein